MNEHNEERKHSRRGLTNSTTGDLLKSSNNNVNQQDFRLKTAPLYPRVVAPVWDSRVITPRSLD